MKININKTLSVLLLLGVGVTFSCEKEDEPYSQTNLVIYGKKEVVVNAKEKYSTFLLPNATYTWTVSSGATIVGDSTGNAVEVKFGKIGATSVDITVTSGTLTGNANIKIDMLKLTPSVSLLDTMYALKENGTVDTIYYLKPLKSGAVKEVQIKFEYNLDTIPTIVLLPTAGLIGTTISAITQHDEDGKIFKFDMTAGAGDGTPSVAVSMAETTVEWGDSVKMKDTIDIKINAIDNTPAVATASLSLTRVKDGIPVDITLSLSEATLNRPMLNVAEKKMEADSILVTIGAGGPMKMTPNKDGKKWTYTYTPSGGLNGKLAVEFSNILNDEADNTTVLSTGDTIEVDNSGPTGSAFASTPVGTNIVQHEGISSEDGNIYYKVLDDSIVAPPTVDDFTKPFTAEAGVLKKSAFLVLKTGTYKVYFLPVDKLGNKGSVSTSVALVMP